MKKILVTIFLFPLAFICKAQDFNMLLGLPADSIIAHENRSIKSSLNGMSTDFVSAKTRNSGGFYLTYQLTIWYDNKYHYSWNDYYFGSDNLLRCAAMTFSAAEQLGQVNRMLKDGYYKISEMVLYKRDQDLKVTIYNTSASGEDQAIFLYSRKDYKTPEAN